MIQDETCYIANTYNIEETPLLLARNIYQFHLKSL